MTHTTHHVRQHHSTLDGQRTFAGVSLPSIPGVAISYDRSETAPTLPTVRYATHKRALTGAAQEAAMTRAIDNLARHIAGLGVLV